MFKAAFPGATEEEEEREMRWIKSMFDMTGMNGGRDSTAVKLAGHWIPPATATSLAGAYRMGEWVNAIVNAEPIQGVAYRKSQRSQQASEQAAGSKTSSGGVTTRGTAKTGGVAAARRSGTTPETGAASSHPAEPVAKRRRAGVTEEQGATDAETVSGEPATNGSAAASTSQDETVSVTLSASRTIRAPSGTAIDPEQQIAQSKADVLRLKQEAQVKSRAGESAADVVADLGGESSAGTSTAAAATQDGRGKKRTADQSTADEATSVSGSTAPLATTAAHGGRHVRRPEEARRNGALRGAIIAIGGAVGVWAVQNFL